MTDDDITPQASQILADAILKVAEAVEQEKAEIQAADARRRLLHTIKLKPVIIPDTFGPED